MAQGFSYQQLNPADFQHLGVYTNTADADYVVPKDAALVLWNVGTQTADRAFDLSLVPPGAEVELFIVASNSFSINEIINGSFSLNDTAPRVVNVRIQDSGNGPILSDGTSAQYNVGSTGATLPLNNVNIVRTGTLTQTGSTNPLTVSSAGQVFLSLLSNSGAGFFAVGTAGSNGDLFTNTLANDATLKGVSTGGPATMNLRLGIGNGNAVLNISTNFVTIGGGGASVSTPISSIFTGKNTMALGTTGAIADAAVTNANGVILVTPGFLPLGILYYQIVDNTSFTILSTNPADAGPVSWNRVTV
jgi:hypothetical protein